MLGIFAFSFATLVLFDTLIEQWLSKKYDESLISKIELMQTLTEFDEDGLEFEFADEYMTKYSTEIEPEYFQIWTNDHSFLEKSKSLGQDLLPEIGLSVGKKKLSDIILPDKRLGRIVYVSFYPKYDEPEDQDNKDRRNIDIDMPPPSPPLVTIAVAQERESLERMIVNVRLIFLIILILLPIALSTIVWFSLKKGMSPLNELSNKIITIDFENEGSYVRLDSAPKELHSVVSKFNLLLDNVRKSIDKEKQFSSNCAHELRTPIAEIRTIAEVTLIGTETRENLATALNKIVSVSGRMEVIVNSLLTISKNEQSKVPVIYELVDIDCLVKECIHSLSALIANKKLNFKIDFRGNHEVMSSKIEMTQIIINLISNAVIHSTARTSIELSWKCHENQFQFMLENTASEISNIEVDKLFQRFWKSDTSRTNSSNTGIGLSLVKVYCDKLDYIINASIHDEIFVVTVQNNKDIRKSNCN